MYLNFNGAKLRDGWHPYLHELILEESRPINFMNSKLLIRNFGPIKAVDLDLRNVNVFIGPQASGKSTIAKLLTILKSPRHFLFKSYGGIVPKEDLGLRFADILNDFGLLSFLNERTEIEYDSAIHRISFKESQFVYIQKLKDEIENIKNLSIDFSLHKQTIRDYFYNLSRKWIYFSIRVENLLKQDGEESTTYLSEELCNRVTENNIEKIIDIIVRIEEGISENAAIYIPAERIFSSLLKRYSLNFMRQGVPIPAHLLTFAAFLETIDLKEGNLDFISKGLKYRKVDGDIKIFSDEIPELPLTEAASGIQSALPILEVVLHSKRSLYNRSFVIEEPELNLSPFAQYQLIQFLEKNREESVWEDDGTIHTYTTHSPYILSCFNNLLYAHKVKNDLIAREYRSELKNYETVLKKVEARMADVIKATVDPKFFSAFQIEKGIAIPIFDKKSGLIGKNYIDNASDEIDDDFEKIMNLLDAE